VVFKVKIFTEYKDVLVHTVNTYKGKRGIVPLILKNKKNKSKRLNSFED